jgi:hypothetical protein
MRLGLWFVRVGRCGKVELRAEPLGSGLIGKIDGKCDVSE